MDYTEIGLDNRLRKNTALPNRHVRVSADEFETYYDVRTNFIDASKADLGELVKVSSGAAAYGTFTTTQSFNLSTYITYRTPHASTKTFGVPMVGIYQGSGTAADDMIYPRIGTNVTKGRYSLDGGVMSYSLYDGTSCRWDSVLTDTTGTSTQVITLAADWLFVDYRSNTMS